jgi:FAD/FMN-containing dehydrogenase
MVSETAIAQLKPALRGDIIQPGDAGYDDARKVYNAMIDRRPRVILRCADAADVMAAVRFGREQDLRIAVRGGGHNGGGLGVVDDGLVIDLSRIRNVHVDPAARTVRVGGGAVWGDVDHATHPFGLAVPTGIISTTGVGGLTLGGGVGNLTRTYGLTIDNLLAADLVLADGSFVTASPEDHPDLYWAIRGGGGNFGVVTAFTFRGNPVHTNYGGPMFWDLEQAKDVMQWYRDFIVNAPEELNGWFAFVTVPPVPPFPEHLHLKKMGAVIWNYVGPLERAEEVFRPIRAVGRPALDAVGPIPHPALNGMFDALYPPGLQWYWRADFFKELSDAAIGEHLEFASRLPSGHSSMHLYPVNGVAHRVGKAETAWSYRDANWAEVIVGVDPDPATNERLISWTKGYWEALHPYSMGGAYVNFMMDEGAERIKATYRDNYARLRKVKKAYDPTNLFRVNQNIPPAA